MIAIADTALDLLKNEKEPEVKICSSSAYWIPLQWLYEKMVANKDLEILNRIAIEEKKRMWQIAKSSRPDKNSSKDRWVLIMMCQAIHVFKSICKND